MAEKDIIFVKSSMKKVGVFNFSDFYKFCYDWLMEETGLMALSEEKYSEKIKPDGKEIDIIWKGWKKLTDYFRFDIQVEFEVRYMTDVEVVRDGKKVKANKGEVKVKVKGILVKDYDGKFEKTASLKFLRSIYERWIIAPRIDQFEDKVFGDSDEFFSQAKAWLDLEGQK